MRSFITKKGIQFDASTNLSNSLLMKTFNRFFLSLAFFMASFACFGQEETKIYAATSRVYADFTYNGKQIFQGTNINTSKKTFLWYDKKVYNGAHAGCDVAYHMVKDSFYNGKHSFDDNLLFTIDGKKAFVQKTNEIAYTYDGQYLYDKDSNTVLLRAEHKDKVPFQMMLAAWLSMQ